MTWALIGFVLALALGLFSVPYALLFRPWRVTRPAYWLMARSAWYRSRVTRLTMRRMQNTMRAFSTAMGAELVPAMKRATAEIEKFGDTLRNAMPKLVHPTGMER